MIEFINMKEENVNEVLAFLDQNNICSDLLKESFYNMFLVKDQSKIYGYGVIEICYDTVTIKSIYIERENRNFHYRDGLIRTMLYSAYLKNIKRAIYQIQNNSLDSFLRRIGFKEEEQSRGNHELYLELEHFFTNKCQNCNGQ